MDTFSQKFSLEGKVALVTGAAYGIGFAIAEAYAQAGAKIAFNCLSQHHIVQALADYKATSIDAKGYICDVTNDEDVKKSVADIEKELGTIDSLVNNAGIIKRIPMTEMSVDDFRQVIDIDLNAPFIVSKAVIPGMIKKGHGKIINVCSMMSELGRETVSAYAAAKGGLKMLTRTICSEFGGHHIQCNGPRPGSIPPPPTPPLRAPHAPRRPPPRGPPAPPQQPGEAPHRQPAGHRGRPSGTAPPRQPEAGRGLAAATACRQRSACTAPCKGLSGYPLVHQVQSSV